MITAVTIPPRRTFLLLKRWLLFLLLIGCLPLSMPASVAPLKTTSSSTTEQTVRASPSARLQHPKDGFGFHLVLFILLSLIFPPVLFVAAVVGVSAKRRFWLGFALTLFFLATGAWITAIVYLATGAVSLALLLYTIMMGTGIIILFIGLFLGTRNTTVIP